MGVMMSPMMPSSFLSQWSYRAVQAARIPLHQSRPKTYHDWPREGMRQVLFPRNVVRADSEA
jgi:hypothetical protein